MNAKLRSYACYLFMPAILMVCTQSIFAQTVISTINTNTVTTGLTTSTYTATAPSDAGGSVVADREYTVNYGQIQNLFVTSYVVGGTTYDTFVTPDTLIIQRTDAGRQLIIFYEYDNVESTGPPYNIDIDAEEQDNEEALYQSGLLNAGYDNILVNDATNFANVERIDIIYTTGIVTSTPGNAVFPIIDRGGNDEVQIAAILSLDSNDEPASYGSLVSIVDSDFSGGTGISHESLVMRRQDATSDPLPQATLGTQDIRGVAVSLSELGVSADEVIYGYSLFAHDVNTGSPDFHDLTDISTFPTNTNSTTGLDLVAGISTAVASDDNLVRSTGPGGYKAALSTWLKANAGVTTATDGSNVTDWQDQWLADNDATTLVTAPTYEDDAAADINFNPTVDFVDGVERGLQIADNPEMNNNGPYTTKSINIAFRTGTSDITTKQQIFEEGGGTNGLGIYVNGGDLHLSVWNRGNSGSSGAPWNTGTPISTVSTAVAADTEYIVTLEYNGNSGITGTVEGFLNGQSFGSLSSAGLLYNHTDNIGLGDVAGGSLYDDGSSAAASFYGSIPEFIYCNEPGSASFGTNQRQRTESYLALKYGITLNQSTAINYLNSDGDIIFNTTNMASIGGYLEYNDDIAGIGRDDNSEFLQLQSQSENANSLVEIHRSDSSGIGVDDTWLIWGNDDGALTESSSVSSPASIKNRLERVWRVAEEGSMGNTDISFDLTGLGLGTTATDFSLLVAGNSSGADFSSATIITGGTFNGDVITFTDVNLADGEYFTLATENFFCTPGNYDDGAIMWLRADEGVTTATEGATVTAWDDQTPSNNDAANITAPLYRASTELVNFNPTIDFSTGSTGLSVTDASGLNVGESLSKKFSIVFRTDDDITTKQVIYEQGGATRGLSLYIRAGSLYWIGWNRASDGTGAPWNTGTVSTISTSSIATNTEYLVTFDYAGNDAITGTIEGYLDGQSIGTISSVGRLYGHTDDIGIGDENGASRYDDGTTSGAASFDGQISELTYYDSPSSYTDADRKRIESNLALKYGVTLTNNDDADGSVGEVISGAITEGDYVASNGTTIFWDYSAHEPTYINDVAGIGRDDDACLEQKQSRSNNSDAIVTMGLGEIASSNATNGNSFASDRNFLTWANDDGSTAFANRTTSGTPGTVTERMLRVWKAQETGTVGATDISFDLTGLAGYSTNATDYQLIIASGGDNTSLESGTTVVGGTFNGNVLTFNDVNLTDGQFFTLGVARTSCGPGGVTSNLQIWLRADLGTNTTTNGSDVTSWSDQSGNSNNATATNAPVYNNNNHNYNPSIDFTNTNSDVMSISDASNQSPDQQAVFLVGTMESGSGTWSPFIMKTASFDWPNGWGLARNNGGTEIYYHKDSYTDNNSGADYASRTITYGIPNVHTAYMDGTDYHYSLDLGTEDTDTPGSAYLSSNNVIFLGATPDGTGTTNNTTPRDFLEGTISEVIMFDDDLTAPERLRVASYLAIKYGITLDNGAGGTAGDYVRADGTNIWDASDYSTYHNDVAGIGRDDDACFIQKQSSGISDDILAIGLDTVALTNADNANVFDDDGDYLMWGHDNGATAQASAETSDVPSTVSERMTRVWRVNDTGAVGDTEIEFDLTGLGYGSDASDFRLIISNTSTMADGTLTAGGTFDGNTLSFSGVNLTDGQYFTLGTALTTCGPGGVNTNIALWLRADLEVFEDAGTDPAEDGDNVVQWNDQSSPADNASEVDGGGGSPVEPTFETNEINYNPALLITDQNTTNNSYMETSSNSVSGDMTLIAVFNTAQSQGSTSDFSQAPALIGANAGGTDDYGLGLSQGQLHLNAANNSSLNARSTGTYVDGEPYIATGTRVQAASGAINLYANSASVATGTSDNVALSGPNSFAIGNHSTYTNAGQFQGDIAEALVFSSVLTGNQRARVESYLAVKYGITRDVAALPAAEQDYRAGDDGIIWDYDGQGTTYYNDIAGIGRDDLSCFEQPHSKSENDDAIVDISIGSFSDDDSWLLWGNDNAAIEAPGNIERPETINSRLNREWRVQETGTIGTVSLTYDLSDITGTPLGDNNLNLVRLMVDDDGDFVSGASLISPTSIDAIAKTVTFDVNFTTGQYFTLGSTEVDALPITLISFNAELLENNSVEVKWSTAQEIDNAFFTIERSRDAQNFEAVGFKEGAGNSTEILDYTFIDNKPWVGTSYYRLVQTDFNGDQSFSQVSRIERKPTETAQPKLYPNPVRKGQDFHISYPVEQAQTVQVVIFNTQGKVMSNQSYSVLPEESKIILSTARFAAGIHLVKVIEQGKPGKTLKLIVK